MTKKSETSPCSSEPPAPGPVPHTTTAQGTGQATYTLAFQKRKAFMMLFCANFHKKRHPLGLLSNLCRCTWMWVRSKIWPGSLLQAAQDLGTWISYFVLTHFKVRSEFGFLSPRKLNVNIHGYFGNIFGPGILDLLVTMYS